MVIARHIDIRHYATIHYAIAAKTLRRIYTLAITIHTLPKVTQIQPRPTTQFIISHGRFAVIGQRQYRHQ